MTALDDLKALQASQLADEQAIAALWASERTTENNALAALVAAPTLAGAQAFQTLKLTNQAALSALSTKHKTAENAAMVKIVAELTPTPTRSITVTISTTISGRVDLQEVGFVASDRRRDGGIPNTGDSGWSGPIVGGAAPGRDLTFLKAGTTYVVGMRDSVKGDWIETSVTIPGIVPPPLPPPGNKALVCAGMGCQTDRNDWLTSQTAQWNSLAGGVIPWGHFRTATVVETDLDIAAGKVPGIPGINYIGAPRPVLRISGNLGDYHAGGPQEGNLIGWAKTLKQLSDAQGGARPIIRPFYEWDGNWMPWSIDRNNITPFVNAVKYIVGIFRTYCPNVEVTLSGSLGYGSIAWSEVNQNKHDLWDAVFAALLGYVDYSDFDSYNNGMPSVAWLNAELAMIAIQARTVWLTRIAHGEWGIGAWPGHTSFPYHPSQGPWVIDAATYTRIFVAWWLSLPASGPGSFGRVELFDVGTYIPPGSSDPDPLQNTGDRSVLSVPVDGPATGTLLKQLLT